MKRRKFLLASGSAVLSGFGMSQLHQPAVSVDFKITGSNLSKDPSQVDSIVIQFEKLELTPKYLDNGKAMSVTVRLKLEDSLKDELTVSNINFNNSETINLKDLELLNEDISTLFIDGYNTSDTYLSGVIEVIVNHPDISEKSYKKSINISDNEVRPLKPDLDGWWKLNETEQDTAFDSSDNENDATVVGAGPSSTGTTNSPIYSSAYKFDSDSSDYVEIPSNTILQPSRGPRFSISAWVRHNSLSNTQYYVSRIGDSNAKDYTGISFDLSKNKFRGFIYDDSVSNNYKPTVYSDTTPVVDTWYHIVLTKGWDGTESSLKIYINGTEENSLTDPNRLDSQSDSASELRIGLTGYESGPMDGAISDVRIYSRTLTSEEVSTLYDQRL